MAKPTKRSSTVPICIAIPYLNVSVKRRWADCNGVVTDKNGFTADQTKDLWKRQRSSAKVSDQPGLNERGSELIGRTFVVHQAIVDGRGKVKVGDGVWMVTGPDSPVGAQVRVVGQEGVVLRVETV